MKPINAIIIYLTFALVFTVPILHYNHCQFLLKEHELKIDEQRAAPPTKSIFDLGLPGVPLMPDHLPDAPQQPSTI